MKIAILGAGAVGSYYGATLQKKGFDVTLICRGEHYKKIFSIIISLFKRKSVFLIEKLCFP